MHSKPAKLMFATLLVTSVGFATVSAQASKVGFSAVPDSRSAGAANVVEAQEEHHDLEDKAQGKVNEMHDMGTGAANAVEEKHEEHEAGEARVSHHRHHRLKHKAESKADEVKGEATGAANAVEGVHQEHERAEHE
jgi:hypothetical protein